MTLEDLQHDVSCSWLFSSFLRFLKITNFFPDFLYVPLNPIFIKTFSTPCKKHAIVRYEVLITLSVFLSTDQKTNIHWDINICYSMALNDYHETHHLWYCFLTYITNIKVSYLPNIHYPALLSFIIATYIYYFVPGTVSALHSYFLIILILK